MADAGGQAPERREIETIREELAGGVDVETCVEYELVVPAWRCLGAVSVPGDAFPPGTSFVRPLGIVALKGIEKVAGEQPSARLVCWGHTDAGDGEGAEQAESERRAKSVHALITGDAGVWEALDQEESWGLDVVQEALIDVGYDPGATDGQPSDATTAALEAFQKDQGLTESGEDDAPTRKALWAEYFAGHPIHWVEPEQLHDPPWVGCGARNPLVEAGGPCAANRRVVVYAFHERLLPELPCGHEPDSEHALDPRSVASFGCYFYDKVARDAPDEQGGGKSQPPSAGGARRGAERGAPVL